MKENQRSRKNGIGIKALLGEVGELTRNKTVQLPEGLRAAHMAILYRRTGSKTLSLRLKFLETPTCTGTVRTKSARPNPYPIWISFRKDHVTT